MGDGPDLRHHAAGALLKPRLAGHVLKGLNAIPLRFDDRLEARTGRHRTKHAQGPKARLGTHELRAGAPQRSRAASSGSPTANPPPTPPETSSGSCPAAPH